jgi:hypothetical protein
MFERFTQRARRALVLGQEEARLLGHNVIGTEHLLLGLLNEGEGVAASVLVSFDITLDTARQKVDQMVATPAGGPVGSPPFSTRAKKVLELSLRESLQLGHNYIETEHILLGLIREGDGTAVAVLREMGADLAQVRFRVIQAVSQSREGDEMTKSRRLSTSSPTWLHADRPESIKPSVRGLRPRAGAVGRRVGTAQPPRVTHPLSGTVELAYGGGRLTGVVDGGNVDVVLDLRAAGGTTEGTFAGCNVSAVWKLTDDSDWPVAAPASLSGRFAGETVELLVWIHFQPPFHFDHCTVEGELAGRLVSVYIEQGDPASDTGTFSAHGIFADSDFSIHGFVPCGHEGFVEGAVSGRPVRLRAKPQEDRSAPTTITGTYDGPASLLLLVSAATIFFL